MARLGHAPRRGLTLIELMIGLAMIAVLMSLAVPSFNTYLQRHRLKSVALGLEADLREARHEAVRRGRPVRVSFQAGPEWCYAIAIEPGCDCRNASPCRLKAVRAADVRGVQLLQAQSLGFDPASGVADTEGGGATWGVPGGERLRVSVNALGRPSVCVQEGQLAPLPGC
ncbi:MAG: GspH/FimT family pseudopilin [Rubrivivax sp.]